MRYRVSDQYRRPLWVCSSLDLGRLLTQAVPSFFASVHRFPPNLANKVSAKTGVVPVLALSLPSLPPIALCGDRAIGRTYHARIRLGSFGRVVVRLVVGSECSKSRTCRCVY